MQPGDCSFLFCTFSSDRFVVVFLPELAIIRKNVAFVWYVYTFLQPLGLIMMIGVIIVKITY